MDNVQFDEARPAGALQKLDAQAPEVEKLD